nr:hypothetical protein [Tanacetum cinerariifolium]
MPTTRQGANVVMTMEAIQAMIYQTLLRNNTTNDGSQNSDGRPRRPVQPARKVRYLYPTRCCTNLWNGQVRTLGPDASYSMTWEVLKKKLTDKGYTHRFQELAVLCTKFLFDETEKIDKYISGLPDNIHGHFMSARTKNLDDAIELAIDLVDQKLHTYAERQAENKRKLNNNNQAQQQCPKRKNVIPAYAVGFGEKKPYGGS